MERPGHDLGHTPAGATWAELVNTWREERGGWTALAEDLARRAGAGVELPTDLGSIERGLRRLSRRGQNDGGQYGRWALRFFGVPRPIASWLRWMGQYHHRFSDLPLSLRRQQLELWDRPPISESTEGAWVDLGMASVGMRGGDRAMVDARVASAGRRAPRAGMAAVLEHTLLVARIASDDGDQEVVREALDTARQGLDDGAELSAADHACYLARLLDAEAYRALHPTEGEASVEEGEQLYRAIPEGTDLPFVDFRRDVGLAYCALRRGARREALELALSAADHAGDGGLVRLRVMALNLARRAADEPEASVLHARAERLARQLEDEDLLARVQRR